MVENVKKKEYIYLEHFTIYLKLTHCKSIIFQYKFKKKTYSQHAAMYLVNAYYACPSPWQQVE